MSAFARSVAFCLIAGSMVAAPGWSVAQDNAKTEEAKNKTAEPVDPLLAEKLRSPQSTMQAFLLAVNEKQLDEAADCLDFSDQKLTKDALAATGGRLAFKLKDTIDRMMRIDLSQIPDESEGEPYRLAYQADGMGDEELGDAGLITIARSRDGLWRFTPATVAEIDGLYSRWEERGKIVEKTAASGAWEDPSIWLEKQFDSSLKQTHFLFPDYQWLSIIVVILIGFLADLLTRGILRIFTAAWFKFRRGEEPPEQKKMWKPVGLFAQSLVWYNGTWVIGLPAWTLSVLLGALKAFAVIAAVWTAFHLIDLVSGIMKRRAERTPTRFDDLLVPLVSKSLKFIAACLGVVVCAEAFDWKITGLLAGIGIGGMALALASKDAVSNLFGSITVLLDRPFEVGDWVVTGDIEGTVEAVGFRSTRIRTFYNSLVTVPNSNLTTAVVDNMGKRSYRRVKTTLGLQYDATPEQIDAFCEGVRELLRRHPYTRKDYYHVYLNQLGGSSLDVMLYCFLDCPDWSVELRERHRLLIDILKLADQLGVAFAFPTQTLHMFQEQSGDAFDPATLGAPERAGQRAAAQIAGPLLVAEDRPGGVQFTPPSE